MSRRQKIALTTTLIAIVIVLVWFSWIHYLHPPVVTNTPPVVHQEQSPATQKGEPARNPSGRQAAIAVPVAKTKKPIPKPPSQAAMKISSNEAGDESQAATPAAEKEPTRLPPPAPLPTVSEKTSEAKRKELFALQKSVDHIVTAKEPFKVNNQEWTIDKIKKRLWAAHKSEDAASGHEDTASSYVKRTIEKPTSPIYYGVRLVRPGENIWNIHYNILREYFARRHVRLPPNADEPLPNGQSTGIGRLLKFLEGVVYVYDIQHNRLVKDLNRIQPQSIIVFFKISEVFSALDRLSVEDLQLVHYISKHLIVEDPVHPQDLLNQDALRR